MTTEKWLEYQQSQAICNTNSDFMALGDHWSEENSVGLIVQLGSIVKTK